jgi:hypothetical protein
MKEAKMKAEVKALESPGVVDLWDYKTNDNGDFEFRLEMFIGPVGEERSDLFTVIVCGPSMVKGFVPKKDFSIEHYREKGNHYLVMKRYDYTTLRIYLDGFVSKCSGRWWGFISWQIRKIAKWERKAKNTIRNK